MKKRLIEMFKQQYDEKISSCLSETDLISFWKWFEEKSELFEKKTISTSDNKYDTLTFEVYGGGCYHNSIKVNQILSYDYYEGLYCVTTKTEILDTNNPSAFSHGFNVTEGKVNDVTFQKTNEDNAVHYYLGVKIDNDFIKEVIEKYHSLPPNYEEVSSIQLIIPFFLKVNTNVNYLDDFYYDLFD